ncbi:hypothetical protein VNO80_11124 [Phaseolus coccineus]|uniref:Uncharacterized protein n=1 Tax=Phaseolus coccineus TaxID=3886 RepID=A0AAN9N9I3_PHACN
MCIIPACNVSILMFFLSIFLLYLFTTLGLSFLNLGLLKGVGFCRWIRFNISFNECFVILYPPCENYIIIGSLVFTRNEFELKE